MKENISEHITYAEATHSETAIRAGLPNEPNDVELKAMKLVAEKCFEPTRKHFGVPMKVSSFFRDPDVNIKVGGSTISGHCKGEAIDVQSGSSVLRNSQIFHYVKDNLDYDQLIWEFGTNKEPAWVHMSYRASGNRKQVLKAISEGGKTKYLPYE